MFIHDIAPAYCRVTVTDDKQLVLTVVYNDPEHAGMTSGFICTTGTVMSPRIAHEDPAKVIGELSAQLPGFIKSIPNAENQALTRQRQ